MKDFVHLHVHTEYSLLDGSGKISKLIERTKELGMKAIAMTDHGTMYGAVEFYKQAVEAGIKPIIGCEVYVAGKSMYIKEPQKDNDTYHLVLLVKNEVGYGNLMKIVSAASIEGFYYKPRVDFEYIKNHCEGLIACSACLGGEVQKNLLRGDKEKAVEIAMKYKEIFGEDFYLELQYHGISQQLQVNEMLIELSKECDIPLICTNDLHYIKEGDSKSHDILLCIQTAKTVEDKTRMRYPSDQFYLKSAEEMYEVFSYVPEALENTVKIAEKCNFDYRFHESKLPKFPLPEGVDPFEYLKETCYKGLFQRYKVFEGFVDFDEDKVKALCEENQEARELCERLDYELGIIKQMGYVDYFLIVWDFIKYAVDNGIPTGPGRGCFLPGTKVLMANGSIKNIEEVKAEEQVITGYGNKAKVDGLLTYEIKERISVIESVNEILKLTEDHKVLAVKGKPCIKEWKDKSKLPVVCKNSCKLFIENKCSEAPCGRYEPSWVEAKDIRKNDFIVYPRTKENSQEIRYDLVDYCKDDSNVKYDENHIWYEIGTNKLSGNKINRFITLDHNLCRLYGYFISEGWTHLNADIRTYKFGFGFNSKEVDYIKEVEELCLNIFGIQGRVYKHKEKQSTAVEFNSKIIAKFLEAQCSKGANNKRIPYDVVSKATNEELKIIISYMFRGDGSFTDITSNGGSFRLKYTTTSIELTKQMRMVLARLGYWATFKTRVKEKATEHDEYSVLVSGKQLLQWNENFKDYQIPMREQNFYRNDSFYMDENYFYIKVKNTDTEEYEGKVYDISVPGDTSYVANSMAVHNSAAGAIVAYTLDITKIDPIKYSLIFERFLNPERVSMPDIDSDFCYEGRQRVIDYVVEKYGKENVAQIITFGTMAPRACIRDVGRAMNYSYSEVDKISKMIPTVLGISIDKALEMNPELKAVYDEDERIKELIDVARDLEGLPRHSSTHAAGVVIASHPLVEYVPLQKNDEMIVTQFTMGTLEELGLLKMDFLGLRTLTVMDECIKNVWENRGIKVDIDHIDFDDPKVYHMIGEGKTVGVFQLESAGMTNFMKDLKPDCLEDIIAGISLYRPGPMAEIPKYIEGKRNPEKVQYVTPQLESILDVTYGVMVYQGAKRSTNTKSGEKLFKIVGAKIA